MDTSVLHGLGVEVLHFAKHDGNWEVVKLLVRYTHEIQPGHNRITRDELYCFTFQADIRDFYKSLSVLFTHYLSRGQHSSRDSVEHAVEGIVTNDLVAHNAYNHAGESIYTCMQGEAFNQQSSLGHTMAYIPAYMNMFN